MEHGNFYGLKQKQGVFRSGTFFPALMLASLILNFLQSMEFIWDMKCVDSVVEHMLEEHRFSRASRLKAVGWRLITQGLSEKRVQSC